MQFSTLNMQPTNTSFVDFCWHSYTVKLSLVIVDYFNVADSIHVILFVISSSFEI